MIEARQHLDVISAPERVAAVLSPIRRRLLEHLNEPDSASGLSRRLGIPRQKINYHLRELERAGFVELDHEQQQRGCTERVVRVTSRAFVISHGFLQNLAADPDAIRDKFSSAYLIASAGRVVQDVAVLREQAAAVEQHLPTLAIETEISFASPADLKAFYQEIADSMARLSVKYNRQPSGRSRRFRVFLASHPVITKTETEARAEAKKHTATKKHRGTARPGN
jgi:DNA-binding transcriptional ArsR family regulator